MEASNRRRWIGIVASVAAASVLAVGGWWLYQRQHTVTAPALAADPGQPFAAIECKPRLFDDQPALAVVFTQPVDGRQKLDDLIRVTDLGPVAPGPKPAAASQPEGKIVQGAWVIGDNPRVAYFPAIQPQRRFKVEVLPNLLSQDGAKLAEGKTCELTSEAMPASFYFASRGVVLPAGQNGGLPVVTVNVPEVDLQFLRVEPQAMPRFLERVAGVRRAASDGADTEEGGEGDEGGYEGGYGNGRRLKGLVGGWELDQLRASTTSVYLGRFSTEQSPNKRRVNFIPVEGIKELQEPGVYIAVMNQPGRFGYDYQVTYF